MVRRSLAPLLLVAACAPDPAGNLPPGSFAFAVFGDGPYYLWEERPFERLIDDVNGTELQWLIHVGDILNGSCDDATYEERLADIDRITHPVIYTPGDNEWTDCWAYGGGYDPLNRLESLRRIFFASPGTALGGREMALETQAADSAWTEFPEHVMWTYGGFVFAALHVVGSENGLESFPGRTLDSDAETERRTAAVIRWLDSAFTRAAATSAHGVVLALHGNIGLDPQDSRRGYYGIVQALERQVAGFDGRVLLIHGDSHTQRVDQPLVDPSGTPYSNFTRLETFGSPDIGWIRVVVDSVTGTFTAFEPRRLRGWW